MKTRPPTETVAQTLLHALWRVEQALGKRSKQMETMLGITFQQRTLIRLIGRFPSIPASRLADELHVDRGTISAALGRLEARRLVERRRDPRDGRRVLLGLTQAGRELDLPSELTIEAAVEETVRRIGATYAENARAVLEELVAVLGKMEHGLPRSASTADAPRGKGNTATAGIRRVARER